MENTIFNEYNYIIKNINSMSCTEIQNRVKSLECFVGEYDSELNCLICSLKDDCRVGVKNIGSSLERHIHNYYSEVERVRAMYGFDLSYGKSLTICGVDEVGRGPLAGPIVGGAVILDLNLINNPLLLGIKDSKKLSPIQREKLSTVIMNHCLYFNISVVKSSVVDEKGISWSNNEVLLRASTGLKFKPDIVLSDGYSVKNINIPNEFIIKGDVKSASIACASIIAKVYRDSIMKEYSLIYPLYGFDKNMGYGTKEHINAIKKYGPCEIHRASFLKNIL